MGEFVAYSLQVAIVMALLYVAYRLLMATSTFHTLNRYTLLVIIAMSWIIPVLPSLFTDQGDVVVEALLVGVLLGTVVEETAHTSISWQELVIIIYYIGVALSLLLTLFGAVRMIRLIRSGKHTRIGGYILVVTPKVPGPLSWGKWIVIRPEDCDAYRDMILRHEMAHLERLHWVDLILAQINLILQWFNPTSWLLIQSLKLQHEYRADQVAGAYSVKDYQLMLLKKAVGTGFPTFADNLHHSQIKQRLTMMTKSKSNAWRLLAALAIPAMAGVGVFTLGIPAVANTMVQIRYAILPDISDSEVNDSPAINQTSSNVSDNVSQPAKEIPAYFVNGKLFKGNLTDINPEEIASIEVKKDDPDYPQGKVMITLKSEAQKSISSAPTKDSADKHIVLVPQEIASFKGGMEAMRQFLAENLQWPEGETLEKTERVVIQFTVGTDGSVTQPEIMKGINPKFDAEAIRVVSLMNGHWNPAMDNGKPVTTRFTIPVSFRPE